jgi:hypothetical protein
MYKTSYYSLGRRTVSIECYDPIELQKIEVESDAKKSKIRV